MMTGSRTPTAIGRDDTTDVEIVRDAIADMYERLGDRAAFDRHLHPDLTVWETPDPRLLRGIAELDELRGPAVPAAERTSAVPVVRPVDVVVDAWSDAAVARYVLEVRDEAQGAVRERVRVTDVLRRFDGRWRIIHHHAQDLAVAAEAHASA